MAACCRLHVTITIVVWAMSPYSVSLCKKLHTVKTSNDGPFKIWKSNLLPMRPLFRGLNCIVKCVTYFVSFCVPEGDMVSGERQVLSLAPWNKHDLSMRSFADRYVWCLCQQCSACVCTCLMCVHVRFGVAVYLCDVSGCEYMSPSMSIMC